MWKTSLTLVTLVAGLCFATGMAKASEPADKVSSEPGELWLGMVFAPQGPDFMSGFRKLVTEALAPMGLNTIIFDMHWHGFRYRCYPELSRIDYTEDRGFTKEETQKMAAICRENGIRVMVGMNILTHQNYGVMLKAFPEFAEPGVKDVWCPLHPKVNEVAFKMMDELLDAFQADAFHVGMDEAWGFQSKECMRCRDKEPARLFARVVKDMHAHLVGKRKVEMLMWGDMLLGWHGKGAKPATDLIPKDIIICDWHYNNAADYPSVRFFLDKGFRVWPCGWKDAAATRSFVESSLRDANERMLGHLYTTWCGRIAQDLRPALLQEGEQSKLDRTARGVAAAMRETIQIIKPTARTRIDLLTPRVEGIPAHAFLSDTLIRAQVSVTNEGNFGLPIRSVTAQLGVETTDGEVIFEVGSLSSATEQPAEMEFKLPTGNYRLVVHGTAKFAGGSAPGDFTVWGRPFQVVEPNWREKPLEVRVKGVGLDGALPEIAQPPAGGNLLATLTPAQLAASRISQRNRAWLVGLYPDKNPQALVISFPTNTRSAPGDFCQVTFSVDVPAFEGKLHVQLFLADNFRNELWPGYRFYQLLHGDQILWEEDIEGERKGRRWTSIDISELAMGQEKLLLTLRVFDKRGVVIYPTTSLIGPVRLMEF